MTTIADLDVADDNRVRVISRTVQWRIDVSFLENCHSGTFKLGNWNWSLKLARSHVLWASYALTLKPIDCFEQNLYATLALRIAHGNMTGKPCLSNVRKSCFMNIARPFTHEINNVGGKHLLIEVEFQDLKIRNSNDKKVMPEWTAEGTLRVAATPGLLNCLSRMFNESLHADITINTTDGTLKAHKAILAASSSVFACMFDSDFKENSSSTIDILDMSFESCKTFLSYLYGDIREEEFWIHRVALLEAAHKYGIVKLQNLCEETLILDINSSNVLQRLNHAHVYELKNLKKVCLAYLFDLGKVHDIRGAFSSFLLDADRGFATELIEMVLAKNMLQLKFSAVN